MGTATSGDAPTRNSGAQFFLANENEWYKAAYYNPTLNSGTGGYVLYGNGFNTPAPTAVSADSNGNGSAGTGIIGSGTGNRANFGNTAVWNLNPQGTTVGTNGAASYYGAFDMSGNIYEWNDLNSVPSDKRGVRGAGYGNNVGTTSSAERIGNLNAIHEAPDAGFRLASAVPEPATLGMTSVGALCACGWWILKRRRRART